MQFGKSCQNLCSLRLLTHKRKHERNFNPIGSKVLHILLLSGRINIISYF